MNLPISEQITFLYTRDLQASAVFYENVLGLSLALDQGSCRIYHVNGHQAYIGVCERDVPKTPDGVIFTFVTPDVDGWYAQITERGGTPEYAPRLNETYGIYHFFIKDPSGYLLEFQRFQQVDWDMTTSAD